MAQKRVVLNCTVHCLSSEVHMDKYLEGCGEVKGRTVRKLDMGCEKGRDSMRELRQSVCCVRFTQTLVIYS